MFSHSAAEAPSCGDDQVPSEDPEDSSERCSRQFTSLPPLQLPTSTTSSFTAAPSSSTATGSTIPNGSSPRPRTVVDSLAHKLSKQNLQLDGRGSVQPQIQSLPPPTHLLTPQPWSGLDIDDEQHQPHVSEGLPGRSLPLSLSSHSDAGRQLDVDEAEITRPEPSRLQRQRSRQFNDKSNSTRAVHPLLESMISTGTQCNVQSAQNAPLPPPPPTPTPITSLARLEPIIEPDPDLQTMELEVDEAYCNGTTTTLTDEDMLFVDNIMSLRRAGTPGGIRKHMIGGVALRYQLSADAALRCQTVVRSRPRMRKRKNHTRPNSVASSAITSAVGSPVIPPSIPSPHSPTYP
ncbi:hypothetical protein B0T22DRAFT_202388 [Podospora appendiculata]|uniref:Uncharacterized protein n=1 Tax=Podospora appendiculata TaxID=314037 RepID=A0AAE0X4H2_9PEZI|nr:hypothetical protein B0T22DRAFT_202388 [Podospora appendiculata]